MSESAERIVVVLPLARLDVGERFAVDYWPLHVTVVAPFSTHSSMDEVEETVIHSVRDYCPLRVTVGGEAMFGRRQNIPVNLIRPHEGLFALQSDLQNALQPLMVSPRHPSQEFRPHVTAKRNGRVHEDDRLTLSHVAVVDMAPRSEPRGRVVLASVPLGARS
ncbi:2'-5' RNA ligase family protein [Salinibacterium sp. SYSU T00001]|uniref:2'-5' RNA ligase family protein n=1 Tax=Homoserinimonas sedimenticola TaxID=2986805 RepID=UPI00223576DB|nr:2'-5' RNA ligase family protein [Salinibacterium sedimenticola]MCW4384376.1 2'-5' RNA ligase family protein [Salinibacterium sedimenticola]